MPWALAALAALGCPGDDTASPTATDDSSASTTTPGADTTTATSPETTADTTPDTTADTDASTTTATAAPTSSTTGDDVCGDGRIGPTEDCDGELGDVDCVSLGFLGGRLGCDRCSFDTSACLQAACGDGAIEGDEACDGAVLGGQTCVSLGFFAGSLQCADDCADFDTSSCLTSICGNGTIEGDEQCDGLAVPSDCIDEGFVGGALACTADCTGYDDSGCFVCGNGLAEGDEVCDGDDFGDASCFALGFVGGRPECAADCASASTATCYGAHERCAAPGVAVGPGPGSVTSDVEMPALAGDIVDVDVRVVAMHDAVGDLELAILHETSGAAALLMDRECAAADDIDATFNDDALGPIDCVEPIAAQGQVTPVGDLDALASAVGTGEGTWRLSVVDFARNGGGTLDQWCVTITNDEPTEHTLYVANDAAPNSVTAFAIDGEGGLVELAGSPYAAGGDSAFDHHPDAIVDCGAYVYVASYPASIAGFAVQPGGTLVAAPGSPFATASVVSLACDRDGWLFASDFGSSVTAWEIQGDGSLVEVGATRAAGATLGMTYHDDGDRLFVAGFNGMLSVFDHDGQGGLVEAAGSPIATGGNNHSASVHPSGAWVAAEAFHGVNVFAVADDGALELVDGSPFDDPTPCETVGLAWSPYGDRLFVGHRNCAPGQVMVYDVDPDGALAPVAGAPFATGGDSPVGLAVRSTGRHLFVSHADDVATSVLDVAPDGTLTHAMGSPVVNGIAGGHPWLVLR
jgi:6-phosphogluconolactonase (cycloisomerase 2 family)